MEEVAGRYRRGTPSETLLASPWPMSDRRPDSSGPVEIRLIGGAVDPVPRHVNN